MFPHDLFISHRRFDLPNAMVEAISACGANVTWDHDLDLRDRRVLQGIARAMRRARFVALYVSDMFEDSPWCRAEYLNALWVERSTRFRGVSSSVSHNVHSSTFPTASVPLPCLSRAIHLSLRDLRCRATFLVLTQQQKGFAAKFPSKDSHKTSAYFRSTSNSTSWSSAYPSGRSAGMPRSTSQGKNLRPVR